MSSPAPVPTPEDPAAGYRPVLGMIAIVGILAAGFLAALGATTWYTGILTLASASATAVIALPDKGRSLFHQSKLTISLLIIEIVALVVGGLAISRLSVVSDVEKIAKYVAGCNNSGVNAR